MATTSRPVVNADRVKNMASSVRLCLDDTRAEVVAPVVEQIFGLLDGLDKVVLGETPPAFTFNAHWRK
ncbi:MAG TPA: hypothetical protein EYN80_07185 [Alphaproteobacteria bacterium]|nr:hypothetical protein [Alphaproteobacteria bacterium]